MSSSVDKHYDNYPPYYGWNTMDPYHVHVERMPNVVTSDYPRHRNFHFSNQLIDYDNEVPQGLHQQHQRPHHAHKKVNFVEHEKVVEVINRGNGHNEVHHEDTVDADADGFIRLKHKKFELAKWDTFKGV